MTRPAKKRPPDIEHEEAIELVHRYRAGDAKALDALVIGHERLVQYMLRKYGYYRSPVHLKWRDDAAQEARLGVIRAAQLWDDEKAGRTKFWGYAAQWVGARIRRFQVEHTFLVRVPEHRHDRSTRKLKDASRRFMREGVLPTPHLLAERTGVDLQDAWWFEFGEWRRYLDLYHELSGSPTPYGRPILFIEIFPDETCPSPDGEVVEALHLDRIARVVADFTKNLTEREVDIIIGRFVNEAEDVDEDGSHNNTRHDGESLMTIGKRHGVTRECIRQIEVKLLERLRERLREVSRETRAQQYTRQGLPVARHPHLVPPPSDRVLHEEWMPD